MKRLNAETAVPIAARVDALTPEHPAQWGKGTVSAIVAHMARGMQATFDPPANIPEQSTFVSRTLMKYVVVPLMPWPKGKIPAPKGLEPPSADEAPALDAAKVEFHECLAAFLKFSADDPNQVASHPVFGTLNVKQAARLNWKHCDHHLRQFGV